MDLSKDGVLTLLRQVDEYEFEQLVADLLEQYGWETSVTSGSNDGGVDVVAVRSDPFDQKYVVQVKQYAPDNRIGSPAVQRYSSTRFGKDDVDGVVIVTTSEFTSAARETATDLNVKLLDASDLYGIVSAVGGEDVLDRYLGLERGRARSSGSSESTSSPGSVKDQLTVSPPPWFGPDLGYDSDLRHAEEVLRAFDTVAEQYGDILFGPAVLRRYSSCPECQGECYGAIVDRESDETECRYCSQCRNLYVCTDDSWRKTGELKF